MNKLLLVATMLFACLYFDTHAQTRKLKAGPDQTIVAGSVAHLKGQSIFVGIYYWQTSGSGVFTAPGSLITDYRPSNDDIQKGEVQLTLRNRNGRVSDTMNLYIKPCGAINAGLDIVECGYEWGGELYLSATTTGFVGSITWTSNGFGGFDDPHSLNPVYYYDANDVNYANIELYATIKSRVCGSVTDTVKVYFQAAPKLEFPEPYVYQNGSDPVNANVYLYGYASSGFWTTTGSGSFSDPNSTYTAYYPSEQDAMSGCVELIFTSNDPDGPCGSVSGSMTACFNYNPPCPEVSVGYDITECGSNGGGAISVSAAANNAEGIYWGSNGSGTFEDPYAFSTIYYYDPSDVNNAQIQISATVYNSYGCSASDDLTLYLHASPELVFPEPFVYSCVGGYVYANVYLYGYASSGTWTTSGTGTFENSSSTYTVYYPGIEDLGYITLTFSTNDPSGPCGSTSGYMEAYFEDCGNSARAITQQKNDYQTIELHPNPASENITIESTLDLDYKRSYITDPLGRKINIKWLRNSVNIAELQPGTYLCHLITTSGQCVVTRFIKI